MKKTVIVAFALLSSLTLHAVNKVDVNEVVKLRAEIKENFFISNPLPVLDAHTHRTFAPASGVKAEAVTYATERGMRIPAILYLPDPMPKGRIPAFIVVNGHGGDKYCWYSYYAGITYARAGAAVLTYDPAGEGERSRNLKSGTREHDYLRGSDSAPNEVAARKLAGLMLTDLMQAVSYLCSRPEVDSKRIAAGGYSMGSYVMAIAGAIEPRLRAVIMTGGGNLDGEGGYWETCDKPMCQGLPYQSLRFLGDRPAIIYALQAERGHALIWNGREDICNIKKTQEPFFDDLRTRVAMLTDKKENIFTYGFTPAPASHRPYFITKPVTLWLEQQIDFPNWTKEQIEAMPETHISEWSTTTNFPIDKMYATEVREGGTMAVGTDVPAIEREQLSVFTPEEWEKVKQDYMFDVWIAKIGATTSRGQKKPIVSFPLSCNSRQSDTYMLRSGEQNIPVEAYKNISYAFFEQNGSVDFTLESREPITEFEISPMSKNVKGTLHDGKLYFTVPQPMYLVLYINKTEKLFLFADAPDAAPKPNDRNVVSVLVFGVVSDSEQTQTKSIQNAIEQTAKKGQTLYFPAGCYRAGTLNFPNNAKIYLAAGAMLKATDEIKDFPPYGDTKFTQFIEMYNAQNVEIRGRGVIDCNGRVLRDKFGDKARVKLYRPLNSKNLLLEGVVIRDPGSWNTHVVLCENVEIVNVKMLNDIDLSNTDGFDPDCSKNVTIKNCFAYCSDDNIAIKTTKNAVGKGDIENITVKNCVFLTKKSSLKVGTETQGERMSNITFEDNDVVESDRGMALYCSDGATMENIKYINNRFERSYPDSKRCGIHFVLNQRNEKSKAGVIRNVLVKDCTFGASFPRNSEVKGINEQYKVSDITFENLVIEGVKCTNAKEANMKVEYAENVVFK